MKRFYSLLVVMAATVCSASAQYGLNFHHIYGWFSNNTPMELFVANMKEHKVKSVRRISALESEKNRDGLLEFDRKGNLVTHQTAAGHAISKYYYDDSNRVVKIAVRQPNAPDTAGYTVYEYDKKYPRMMTAERMRDRKGKLVKTLYTWETTRTGDTSFTVQKDGQGKVVDRTRSYQLGDTLYYDITGRDRKEEDDKTDYHYQVSKDGKLLQYGSLDKPSYDIYNPRLLPYKAPQVTALIKAELAIGREELKQQYKEAYKKNKELDRDDDRPRFSEAEMEKYIDELIAAYVEVGNEKIFIPSECFVYDDKGRLIEKVSRYDDRTKYTYDEAGRLKTAGDNIYHYDERGLLKAWYQSHNEVKLEYTFY